MASEIYHVTKDRHSSLSWQMKYKFVLLIF